MIPPEPLWRIALAEREAEKMRARSELFRRKGVNKPKDSKVNHDSTPHPTPVD